MKSFSIAAVLLLSALLGCGPSEKERQIQNLVENLKSEDCTIRAAAANKLGEIGDASAVELLIEALKDEKMIVQNSASRALESIGEPAVLPLIELLKDKDDKLRARAIGVLARIGDRRAIEPVIEVLRKDTNAYVRLSAASMLVFVKDPRVVAPLLEAMEDKDRDVRLEVGGSLCLLVNRGTVSTSQPLITALGYKESYIRCEAVRALGLLSDQRGVDALVKALNDKEQDVREMAAWALCEIGDKKAVSPLIAMLERKDWHDQSSAARALGTIEDKKAIEPLVQALKSENVIIRWDAAWALGVIGDKIAVKPLVAALRDEVWNVRGAAAMALAEISDKTSIESLRELWVKEKDIGVRVGAAYGLAKMSKDEEAFRLLTEVAQWKRPFTYNLVNAWAIEALGKVGNKKAIEPLIVVLKDRRYRRGYSCRAIAAEALGRLNDARAVEPLIEVLRDYDNLTEGVTLPSAVAEALGNTGDRKAIQPLIELLKNEWLEVRRAAVQALEKITGRDFGTDYEK